jgi:uncharacterized SAM-binding protein YcdF (DUF218 family)
VAFTGNSSSSIRRSLRLAALVIAAGLLLAIVFHVPIFTALADHLNQSGPPEKADIVFVLAGDAWGHRILKGAELVRQGYAPRVLVSGPDGTYGYYECDLAIPFAVKAGYPASYFVPFPHHARSTRDEATLAAAELRNLGAHRVLLVTSLYHTRRAGNLFRKAAPDLTFIVVAAPDENFTSGDWWHNREARKLFLVEWLKTGASWLSL